MKKLLLLFCFLFIAGFTFAQQTDKERSIYPVMGDMRPVIDEIEKQGQEIVKLEYDLIFSESKTTYRILTDQWTYRIGVVGDYRTSDMDLEIYRQLDDGTYEFVARDTKTTSYAYIDVTPSSTRLYKFVVKCYKFNEGYTSGRYGLIIFHK